MNIIKSEDESSCGCIYRFKDHGNRLTLVMERCVEHEGLGAGFADKSRNEFLISLPTGDKFVEDRFVYTFEKPEGGNIRHFGPYENIDEARNAYYRMYGTRPSDAVNISPYVADPRDVI